MVAAMILPLRVVLVLLVSTLFVLPASAHPHVWVKSQSELVYGPDGMVTGIRQHWSFDDMFSAFAVQGLGAAEKSTYTRQELEPLAKTNIESLKEFDYFTFVSADGKKIALGEPLSDYWLDYKDAVLTLNFTLPLQKPVKAKDLKVEIYDPTYFVSFELAKDKPAVLVGAPSQCKLATELPRELTFAEGKKLSENPEAAANWGAFFANKILVNCP